MGVKIGHAGKDENSKLKGGNAGDQTGSEVRISDYHVHSKGWVVLRCKDAAKRQKIAEAMEKACKNKQIGYDQNQRDTLFNNVKNNGFDPSKTTKNVETDCSALVRVCIAYAYGSDKVGNIRTVNLPEILVKTGLFIKYTSDKYCKSSDYLKRGDILCTCIKGHTVVVLDDGAKVKPKKASTTVKATDSARNFLKPYAGKYKVAASKLNVRHGAGITKKIMVTIPKDTTVECYGYYTSVLGVKWLYVKFKYQNVIYTGFVSSKHLVKI